MNSVASVAWAESKRVGWLCLADISHCPLFSSDSQMYTSHWVLVLGSLVGSSCCCAWLAMVGDGWMSAPRGV